MARAKYRHLHSEDMKKYSVEYRKKNKDKIQEKNKKYRVDNEKKIRDQRKKYYGKYKEKRLITTKKWQVLQRQETYAAYGGKCFCCGESNPLFLTIDHINGGGRKHRLTTGIGSSFYRWLKKNNFPPEFQLLCYNCNCGRYRNGGVCPHVVVENKS